VAVYQTIGLFSRFYTFRIAFYSLCINGNTPPIRPKPSIDDGLAVPSFMLETKAHFSIASIQVASDTI